MIYFVVGLAGALGALARYYVGMGVAAAAGGPSIAGTWTVNMIGCLLLSWLTSYWSRKCSVPAWLTTGVGTGFIGSFTTFSTFSVETIQLMAGGQWGTASLYLLASLLGGLAAAWVGWRIGSTVRVPGGKEEGR
ncbi:fluoride efflux transporter CrcB [Paenibacillus sp. J2TS4]|uniref:fluoride efflux transporter CrcB n=1 Tax=Paenibacillus sp. J2TS4 TaxID=2807194 RepID=UPI0020C05360|nr:fluoride efflux transporter CrcB [Paenibacillus sp. J2TS4]